DVTDGGVQVDLNQWIFQSVHDAQMLFCFGHGNHTKNTSVSISAGASEEYAAPNAMAMAWMPSMRPVRRDLSSLRLPLGSLVATALAAHIVSTGWPPWAMRPFSSSASRVSSAGLISLNPWPW